MWSSSWECPAHGPVAPRKPDPVPTADWTRHVCVSSRVPVWLPWPLPSGWVVAGVAPVGDEVSGVPAVATVLTGPSPLGGPAEMLIVSEEPGVGFATHLAGLHGTDPGSVVDGAPYSHVEVRGHSVPLWLVPTDSDQAIVVGERDLAWVWVVVRPASAGAMLVDQLTFADARMLGEEVRLLPYGARSTWLDPS
jgi:hypothetical protein